MWGAYRPARAERLAKKLLAADCLKRSQTLLLEQFAKNKFAGKKKTRIWIDSVRLMAMRGRELQGRTMSYMVMAVINAGIFPTFWHSSTTAHPLRSPRAPFRLGTLAGNKLPLAAAWWLRGHGGGRARIGASLQMHAAPNTREKQLQTEAKGGDNTPNRLCFCTFGPFLVTLQSPFEAFVMELQITHSTSKKRMSTGHKTQKGPKTLYLL